MSRIPAPVWFIAALWGALLLGASLLWPMSWGYDEGNHVDMASVMAEHPFTFYGAGELLSTKAGVEIRHEIARRPFAGQEPPPRDQRPTRDELGGAEVLVGSNANQMVQHPPLGYWPYAAALNVPGMDGLAWDLQWWLLRLISVVIVLPVPVLTWLAARRLLAGEPDAASGADEPVPGDWRARAALVAMILPLTMPNLVRVGSSVNNDAPLLLAGSVLGYLVVRVMTGDLTRRTAVAVGVSLAAALWIKGFALFLVPVVAAAYLLAAWRTGGPLARRARSCVAPLAIAAVGGAVGGIWWLRNVIVQGTVQPNGYGPKFMVDHWGVVGDSDDGSWLTYPYAVMARNTIGRIWGGAGLPDLAPPGPVVFGWFAVVLLGLIAAAVVGGRSGRGGARVVIGAAVVTLVMILPGSIAVWVRQEGAGPTGSQGRYLYHFVVPVMAYSVVGWVRLLRPGLWRRLPEVVLVAGLLTQAGAWFQVLHIWYARRSLERAVHGVLAWSPVPGELTVLLIVVVPAVAAVMAFVAVAAGGRRAKYSGEPART